MAAPPRHVVAAFGCAGDPVPLEGGSGRSFACGDVVLKPTHNPEETTWIAETLLNVEQSGFRVPRPLQSRDEAWTVDGWAASERLTCEHRQDRWPKTIAVCRALHHALRHVPRPAFLDARNDVFSRADRIAWNDAPVACRPEVATVLDRLVALRQPLDLPCQVVHGDVAENVLFRPDAPPAVIDFSPYWRPAAYAQAVIVTDAMDWHGADRSILDLVSDVLHIDQLLLRAEMFRIAIYDGFDAPEDRLRFWLDGHAATIALLETRIRHAERPSHPG